MCIKSTSEIHSLIFILDIVKPQANLKVVVLVFGANSIHNRYHLNNLVDNSAKYFILYKNIRLLK